MSVSKRLKICSLLTWVVFALGLLVLLEAAIGKLLEPSAGAVSFTSSKPRLFPVLLASGLILVGVAEFILKREHLSARVTLTDAVYYKSFAVSALVMLFYAATFEWLGFMISSSIAMLLLSLSGYRRLRLVPLLLAMMLPAALYMLMVYLLGVYLPGGMIL